MHIYDSKLKQKVKFEPIEDGKASVYLCGPTVYDDAHLGHAKSSISFDLLRRTLEAEGYEVKFVRNFTDIDDKILKKMSESGESLETITERYIARYEADMAALNVLEPSAKPRATQTLAQIIAYIEKLIEKGAAYTLDDGVYFDTSADGEYLSLSGRRDENKIARVASNEGKKDEKDFVLWKFDEKWYESPFGRGRPGWHSECVAMIASEFAGDARYNVDIHAGGADLLFPHHENEAAQCRCALGRELAKYWMHNGFVQINNEKMSKSLGNSFFIRDALALVPGEALRFYLMSTHYRANFNFSHEDLLSAKKRLDKLYRLKKRLSGVSAGERDFKFESEILAFMSDDMNVSGTLGALDEMIAGANAKLDAEPKNKVFKQTTVSNLNYAAELLGIGEQDAFAWFQWGVSEAERETISNLINERAAAKKEKNFARCDEIRNELTKMGVSLMDTAEGTKWEKI